MKSLFRIALIALSALSLAAATQAQTRAGDKPRTSPNATVSQTIGTTVIAVSYGRPGLKGRSLESLAPSGKVWRTGANESCVVTISDDVKIAGTAVKAGTYSLYTIPGKDEWTLILNSKLSWGTQYDSSKDVVRVQIPVEKAPMTEWFTIDFDALSNTGAHLNFRWGEVEAQAPISI